MNKYIYFIVFTILVSLPLQSFAFTPFNPTAKILEEGAALFTISYGFTAGKEPIYVPVLGNTAPNNQQFGFRVRTNNEPGMYENAFGFVLSNAPIKNGMYFIESGKSAVFTAVMVVQASSTDEMINYNTHLNYLPFYQGNDMRFIPLNKYQLETYVTPSVAI